MRTERLAAWALAFATLAALLLATPQARADRSAIVADLPVDTYGSTAVWNGQKAYVFGGCCRAVPNSGGGGGGGGYCDAYGCYGGGGAPAEPSPITLGGRSPPMTLQQD
ncbi:MAG: hypothetical protein ABR507_04255 [Actinomycetota bacterium]|nr:hypothetical protein [Actinomycetota bacterium]